MKEQYEVEALVNYLEKFIAAVVVHKSLGGTENAAALNKQRAALESYIMDLAGIHDKPQDEPADTLKCPDCDSIMALRTNRQSGSKFWGCTKYPKCRGTRDENGLSREEREELKFKTEQIAQESGFSFLKEKRNPVTEVSPQTTWNNPFKK